MNPPKKVTESKVYLGMDAETRRMADHAARAMSLSLAGYIRMLIRYYNEEEKDSTRVYLDPETRKVALRASGMLRLQLTDYIRMLVFKAKGE